MNDMYLGLFKGLSNNQPHPAGKLIPGSTLKNKAHQQFNWPKWQQSYQTINQVFNQPKPVHKPYQVEKGLSNKTQFLIYDTQKPFNPSERFRSEAMKQFQGNQNDLKYQKDQKDKNQTQIVIGNDKVDYQTSSSRRIPDIQYYAHNNYKGKTVEKYDIIKNNEVKPVTDKHLGCEFYNPNKPKMYLSHDKHISDAKGFKYDILNGWQRPVQN